MRLDKNTKAFFALLKAGLWEGANDNLNHNLWDGVNWSEVQRLAEEQSVVGLVAAGIDSFRFQDSSFKMPKPDALLFIGQTLQLEERNKSMNEYLAWLIERLREEDIYAILVKGQGIAQCYERPLWRASGDIDLLLSAENYEKAKKALVPLAIDVEREFVALKHLGMTMPGGIVVELHGMMHSRLSKRVDRVIDEAQKRVFFGGNVRSTEFQVSSFKFQDKTVQVFLPAPNEDVIFVFTHILHHYYIEGVGLRQICDWCRLLWTYRDKIDRKLLEKQIKEAGLLSEWRAFAALAVQYLDIPEEAMPMFGSRVQGFKGKADRIMEFVLESGNFGHNRQQERSDNRLLGKIQAAWYKMRDFICHARVFPLDSVKFFFHFVCDGVGLAMEKK